MPDSFVQEEMADETGRLRRSLDFVLPVFRCPCTSMSNVVSLGYVG